jgi:hypothetical protein
VYLERYMGQTGEREHESERERKKTYELKEIRSEIFTNANTYFCVVLVCEGK